MSRLGCVRVSGRSLPKSLAILSILLFAGWAVAAPPSKTEATGPCRLVEELHAALSGASDFPELDREAVSDLARKLVGGKTPVEEIRLGDLFAKLDTRGEKAYCGITADDRYLVEQAARILLGGPVEEVLLGDLLDRIEALSVSGEPPVSTSLMGRMLGSVQRVDSLHDGSFQERRALQLQYAEVEKLIKQLRREGFRSDEPAAIHQEAFDRLLASGREELVPLLDGHEVLTVEITAIDGGSISLAERTERIREARRYAFGPDLAEALFEREEALERYEVDRLAIELDIYLTSEERKERIGRLREELKVDLATRGSYVGFFDEGRAVAESDVRQRLGDDEFETMPTAEREEAIRAAQMERLPADLQDMSLGIRERSSREPSMTLVPGPGALAATVCDGDPDAVNFAATVNPSLLNSLLGSLPNIDLNQSVDTSFGGASCDSHSVRVSTSGQLPLGGSMFVVTPGDPNDGTLQVDLTLGGALSAGLSVSYNGGSVSCSCDIFSPICCSQQAACAVEEEAVGLAINGLSGSISASNVSVTQIADTCVLGDCTAVHPLDSTDATLSGFRLNLFDSCSVVGIDPCSLLNSAITAAANWLLDLEDDIAGFFVDPDRRGVLIEVFHQEIVMDGCYPILEVRQCQQGTAPASAGLARPPRSRGISGLLYLLPLALITGAALGLRRRRE